MYQNSYIQNKLNYNRLCISGGALLKTPSGCTIYKYPRDFYSDFERVRLTGSQNCGLYVEKNSTMDYPRIAKCISDSELNEAERYKNIYDRTLDNTLPKWIIPQLDGVYQISYGDYNIDDSNDDYKYIILTEKVDGAVSEFLLKEYIPNLLSKINKSYGNIFRYIVEWGNDENYNYENADNIDEEMEKRKYLEDLDTNITKNGFQEALEMIEQQVINVVNMIRKQMFFVNYMLIDKMKIKQGDYKFDNFLYLLTTTPIINCELNKFGNEISNPIPSSKSYFYVLLGDIGGMSPFDPNGEYDKINVVKDYYRIDLDNTSNNILNIELSPLNVLPNLPENILQILKGKYMLRLMSDSEINYSNNLFKSYKLTGEIQKSNEQIINEYNRLVDEIYTKNLNK